MQRHAMGTAALLLIAGPAAAVTVKNTSYAETTVGIDWGDKEKVETAGKSVAFACEDGPRGLLLCCRIEAMQRRGQMAERNIPILRSLRRAQRAAQLIWRIV
jgi:hypothetical protein